MRRKFSFIVTPTKVGKSYVGKTGKTLIIQGIAAAPSGGGNDGKGCHPEPLCEGSSLYFLI